MQKNAHEFVVQHLPTFIYMDEYRAFQGSAWLDQVKQRKDRAQLTEEDKTLLMILELSGLDLESEHKKGSEHDREQRQYDLDDAALTLTKEIEGRWKQLRYEVKFGADGYQFFTFVKDQRDRALIKLEERSRGFQWFFSFDLLFMYESRGAFKNCVILLDEPGLHLHPDAQRDLLDRMETYAAENTLIYTTHLPFMIDLRKPERIRVLGEGNNGTFVSDDLVATMPSSKLTLQAALGMSGSTSYLVAQRNLVVEGVDDFWVVTELSNLLARSGQQGLPEDILITAAGGASEAAYIATFMIGQKLDVAVFLDSDRAGEEAKDKLVKRWITRYQANSSRVLSLADVIQRSGTEQSIEDVFPDDFYLDRVERVYRKELALVGSGRIQLTGTGQLCKRVEVALAGIGIKFNKGSVAKVLRADMARMKTIDDLPPQTRDAARLIVDAVAAALG